MINLTPPIWGQLVEINQEVNRDTTYSAPSPWINADGNNHISDCKGYALAKYDRLLALGWPTDSMFIAECAVPPSVARNHAVLLIEAAQGLYVASNGIDQILPIKNLNWRNWARYLHNGLLEEFSF